MVRLLLAVGIATFANLLSRSPSLADDRELQAILSRQNCFPSQIKVTELTDDVVVHEVTCRGTSRTISVICIKGACQVQAKLRNEEE